MAVFSSGYCKITGLSKAMPESHYIPMMPALSQSEQAQLFGCKITMAAHMEHHYVPVIEFGKGKGLGVVTCRITGRQVESVARSIPLPEEGAEVKRVHRFKRDLRYMEPFVSRLANKGEKAAMEELLERMRKTTQLDTAHYFVYALNDRRTGKTGMVLPYEYEEAIHSGAIESILLSGDSNSLVVKIKDGPMCTIPMDKVGKLQVERLSEEEMIFDGRGPDREIIEQQRREKAAREKEDKEQMAEYLAEMERKRKERDLRKKEKMKETMRQKMAEADEAERRQKAMDEEIKRQYQDAARIRAEAEEAKAAAREVMLAKREQRDALARVKRAEELAEQARLAEEKLQREEAARQAAEEARLAQEAAAANALAAVDPHDMSVNELLEHMRENTGDDALLRDMEEAASIGMSSQQIADMVVTSTIEAIEEEFAEPEEEEEEEEESEEEEEEDVVAEKPQNEDQPDAQLEEMSEEEKAEEEMLRQLREEQLEMKRKEREAKRLERQRKREEQERKEEEKRLNKEAREKKKREMMERMTAIHRADATEEAERMKKPEKREVKPHELLRRKPRPENIEIPPPETPAEYVVQTSEGKAVLTEDELDEMSVIEGRISTDATGGLTPGRTVKTESGVEFIAGRIITSEEGEVFEPGQAIDLPAGPKFVPGQTVATRHGPQFVAGKTIGEGENIEFVPGHVVNLGEDMGEIFVPGQVMETDKGPKFVPGSVYRCRRAGPLFVPGQLRDGEYIPGKIVETEDGPRFMSPKFPGREMQFTYLVQSFDLDSAELDLVKYQYHTPEPSPVFQGQDIGESLNLMQLAARGYQAKTIPLPEQRPSPLKSKRQIYKNVRVTFLDCIDSAERARNAAAPRSLGKDELTAEARRVQRVLADDLNNPLPLSEVAGFLRKCLSLSAPTADVASWIDGLFWHSEKGVFRPMKRMQERKLSRKVSLQKTLTEVVQEMETEMQEAGKRDIVIANLAKVTKKELPLRTHVDDYRERWQEIISGILLTSGKVVLNDVFDVVAYSDEDCVKTVLDDVRERVETLAGDPEAVTALEEGICQYVHQKTEGRLEELLCTTDDDLAPRRDGLTRELLLREGSSLAFLEDEFTVAECLRQCLATPELIGLLPLYHDAMELLRTVLNIHTLSEGDEQRQSLLANFAKNPGLLCDSESWVKLVSGAALITQHVASKPRRLRSAGCVPDEAVALVAEFRSPEVDAVFRNVVLDASRHVHGLTPVGQAELPVMVVKRQFEGILPRHLARDVIHGRLQYLLVNEETVKLVTVGRDEKEKEHAEKESDGIKSTTREQASEKRNSIEVNTEEQEEKDTHECKDEDLCTCYPDEAKSVSRKESTTSLPRKASTASVSRKASVASVTKDAASTSASRKASSASQPEEVTALELETDIDDKEEVTLDDAENKSVSKTGLQEEQEQDDNTAATDDGTREMEDSREGDAIHEKHQIGSADTEVSAGICKQDANKIEIVPIEIEAEIPDDKSCSVCPDGEQNYNKAMTEDGTHEVEDSQRGDVIHGIEQTGSADIIIAREAVANIEKQDVDTIETGLTEIKQDVVNIETDPTELKQNVNKIEIDPTEVEAEITDDSLTLASSGV